MNHHIHLFLKAGQSRMDMVKFFKTTLLLWDFRASFGLTPICANFIDYVECDVDVKDVSNLNKVIGFGTTLHKLTTTNRDHFTLLHFLTIFHQLTFVSLVHKLIINFAVVQVSWIMIRL